jgi:hypothetical protein
MPGKYRRIGIKIPPTRDEDEALTVLYDVLTTGATRVGADFREPDDDWRPVWLVATPTQGTLLTTDGSVDKHAMTEVVGHYARQVGAIGIGHLHSSWMVDREVCGSDEAFDAAHRQMRANGGSTEGLPRREGVLVALSTASRLQTFWANIARADDRPPRLEPWDKVLDSDEEVLHVEGAMIDPLVAALKRFG